MEQQAIAIIGAGTAGLAAAAFLRQGGHRVTLFEKFAEPKPLGAGLLLQPTGLAVLSLLGLDRSLIENGSIIHRLLGSEPGRKTATLHVEYKDYAPHLFGVGTHRGALFSALYAKVTELGVEIHSSTDVTDASQKGGRATLIGRAGDGLGEYDLVIDASGQKSSLRQKYADVKLDRPYPYGAIWSVVRLTDGRFRADTLEQYYKRADHMVGVLPVGCLHGDDGMSAAFFWSMRTADYPRWRAQPFAEWQRYASDVWPDTAALVGQFASHDDLTFASYRDVMLRSYHNGSIVFIGDAAHCTSPQLGQGANLALVDAYVLAQCVAGGSSMQEALAAYNRLRKKHLRFYQTASRVLTPFFQSDRALLAKLRFLACKLAFTTPFTRRMAAQVLTGTRSGLFSSLDPGQWAECYGLRSSSSKARVE